MSLNERFTSEVASFTQNYPHFVRSISTEGENFLIVRLKYNKPFDEVLVHFDDSYRTHYPNGNVTFVINREIKGMPASASPTLARICSTLSSLALTSSEAGGDILKLFPITQEELQKHQDQADKRGAGGSGSGMMMGTRSGSHMLSSLAGAGRHASRWLPEASMDVDLGMATAKLNATLHRDVQQLADKLTSANNNKPAIIDVQNLEAGHVAISFTLDCKQMNKLFINQTQPTLQKDSTKKNPNATSTFPILADPSVAQLREFNKLMDALEMNPKENFTWRLTLDPVQYPQGFCKIEFGQASNFTKGVFPGSVGHLRRILSSLIRTYQRLQDPANKIAPAVTNLLLEGFGEEEIITALKNSSNDEAKAAASLRREAGTQISANAAAAIASSTVQAKRIPRPAEQGLLVSCLTTVLTRLETLCEFCCICDRTHVFASGGSPGMAGSTVCTRGSCQFRFSKLDVARDVASQSAMQTGVMDLLIIMAKCASTSARWNAVFEPFPNLVDDNGKVVCSESNKNIDLCRTILAGFPVMKYLSQSESQSSVTALLRRHHPLAQSMMNWILGSNRAVLTKLSPQHNMTLFGSRHQFRLIMQSPEREKRFQDLKRTYGAHWVFHGSRPDCWYSIMRNGLKNASNTPLQVNGTAYGAGIYCSTHFSTSQSYSNINGTTNDSKMTAHMAEEFIDPDKEVKFMSICEVIEHDLNKPSSNIWVSLHEDHIVTRFLVVYTHGHSVTTNIQLDQDGPKRILNECLALTEM